MKKNERLEAWLTHWESGSHSNFPKEYTAYFYCFNQGDYYEAHDVLEHLWLRCEDNNRSFYQALIQFAGAFVHLQKHAQFPEHPTHGKRLPPAMRLFALANARLAPYPAIHLALDLIQIRSLCSLWSERAQSAASSLSGNSSPLAAFGSPKIALL